ncbi:MAG: hypothetical protein ABSF53_07475 [Terracidiphilus sp.]|jgi:hypothetical protein
MAKQDTPLFTNFEITNHRFFVLLVNDILSADLDELEEDFLFGDGLPLKDLSGRSAAYITPTHRSNPHALLGRVWPGGTAHTN